MKVLFMDDVQMYRQSFSRKSYAVNFCPNVTNNKQVIQVEAS
jgi:hypothetical protein